MDIPCLIHRGKTERHEGLGETAVISNYDPNVVNDFLREPGQFRRRQPLPPHSPSDIIVNDLIARDFAA